MIEEREAFAEFDALGEAEVKARLERRAFDDTHRIYAARWLSAVGSARFQAAQRKTEARRSRGRSSGALEEGLGTLALAFALIAVVAGMLAVNPSLVAGLIDLAHHAHILASPDGR